MRLDVCSASTRAHSFIEQSPIVCMCTRLVSPRSLCDSELPQGKPAIQMSDGTYSSRPPHGTLQRPVVLLDVVDAKWAQDTLSDDGGWGWTSHATPATHSMLHRHYCQPLCVGVCAATFFAPPIARTDPSLLCVNTQHVCVVVLTFVVCMRACVRA